MKKNPKAFARRA